MKVRGDKKQPSQRKRRQPYEKNEDFVDWDSVWAKEDFFYGNDIPQNSKDVDDFDEAYQIAMQKRYLYQEDNPCDEEQEKRRSGTRKKKKKKSKCQGKNTKRNAPNTKNSTKCSSKKKKKHHFFRNFFLFIIIAGSLYSIAVFSDIPFIAKWRAIYIETAMSTMSHQWLATALIPKCVIDDVMGDRYLLDEEQTGLVSNWGTGRLELPEKKPWESDRDYFFRIFHELDQNSFDRYVSKNNDEIYNENNVVMIDKAGLDDDGTDIKTKQGDEVLAVDAENGILIVKVTGEGFVGRLAIVKDPSRVGIGLAKGFGTKGGGIEKVVKHNDAILGINASGFEDPNGTGNGGKAYGLVISDGKKYQDVIGRANKVIAFDKKNRLHIGQYHSLEGFRDAVEFKPALIINGEQLVKGSAGWGIQPRSAVGQTEQGEVLLLVIDGRAPGYSIGATLGDCANIMKDYGAVQACNLDGGSSSVMYYNGREISRPSAANKVKGRAIPNGFMVYKK